MKTIQRILLTSISVALLILMYSCKAEQPKDELPNIVLVFVDDLGYGDLGCYGQQLIQTPNIDRMAEEGIKFTNFYAGTPVCAPSRCNLMTGKHAGHAFIRHNVNQLPLGQLALPDSEVTIPECLKQQGYQTAAFGKWGMGAPGNEGDPLKQGFDYFFGYYCQCKAHNYYPEMLWRNTDTVKLTNKTVPVDVNYIDYPLSYATEKNEYSATLVFNDLMDYINRNQKTPFFAYYASTLPHSNGEAPVDEKYEIPDWGIYADSNWTPQEKGYAAMVSMLDDQMGTLLDKLKALGIADKTLVIFTSDNGPTLFAKRFESAGVLKGRKRDLYEGGIRMPFIAHWPGKVTAGQVSTQPAAMYDLLRTFCDLTGAVAPQEADGQSILPTLLGQQQEEPDVLYWEFYESNRAPKQALRKGDWKLMRFYFDNPEKMEIELYNLANDVSESKNVATEHPEIVEELTKLMEREHSEYVNKNYEPK